MSLVYKTFPFELQELKADGDLWTFTGYASTFGNTDLGNDRIMPGAFDKTLAARSQRPLLWQHDITEPIGVEKSLTVDEHGLRGVWEIIPTTRGRDAYALLKAGAINAMSIGYIAEEYKFDDAGTRDLLTVDLLENSVVTLGMNEDALITAVKARGTETAGRKYMGMGGAEPPDGSYEALSEDIEEAIEAALIPAGSDGYVCVLATYPTHAVACVTVFANQMTATDTEQTYYDIPYVASADGETITLGTPVEVELETTFAPVKGLGMPYGLHAARVESAVREFVERTQAGSVLRRESKEGRAISEGRRAQLAAVHSGMQDHMGVIAKILKETAPAPKTAEIEAPPVVGIDIGYELALRRRRLAGRVELLA